MQCRKILANIKKENRATILQAAAIKSCNSRFLPRPILDVTSVALTAILYSLFFDVIQILTSTSCRGVIFAPYIRENEVSSLADSQLAFCKKSVMYALQKTAKDFCFCAIFVDPIM
jgi:hypothetical protein